MHDYWHLVYVSYFSLIILFVGAMLSKLAEVVIMMKKLLSIIGSSENIKKSNVLFSSDGTDSNG